MEIKEIPIEELKPWDKNPRKHDVEKLVKSIERFGFRAPLVVNRRAGVYTVEAGHGRLVAAKAAGLKTLPCVVVEDDDTTAAAYAVADNRLQEMAEWDESALAGLLKEFDADLLQTVGYSDAQLGKLLQDLETEMARNKRETFDVEQRMAAARETSTNIKAGDIYQLGAHRLMCGDSTNPADVAKLMGGEKAAIHGGT